MAGRKKRGGRGGGGGKAGGGSGAGGGGSAGSGAGAGGGSSSAGGNHGVSVGPSGNLMSREAVESEYERVRAYLESKNLVLRRIPKDGACLFRAVAEKVRGTQAEHVALREETLEYMTDHRGEFEPFLDEDTPFDRYVFEMGDPKSWGSQLELQALSSLLQVNFSIYQGHGENPPIEIENGFDNKPPVLLCFSFGNHYDLVYTAEEYEAGAIGQSVDASLLEEALGPGAAAQADYGNVGYNTWAAEQRAQELADQEMAAALAASEGRAAPRSRSSAGDDVDEEGFTVVKSKRRRRQENAANNNGGGGGSKGRRRGDSSSGRRGGGGGGGSGGRGRQNSNTRSAPAPPPQRPPTAAEFPSLVGDSESGAAGGNAGGAAGGVWSKPVNWGAAFNNREAARADSSAQAPQDGDRVDRQGAGAGDAAADSGNVAGGGVATARPPADLSVDVTRARNDGQDDGANPWAAHTPLASKIQHLASPSANGPVFGVDGPAVTGGAAAGGGRARPGGGGGGSGGGGSGGRPASALSQAGPGAKAPLRVVTPSPGDDGSQGGGHQAGKGANPQFPVSPLPRESGSPVLSVAAQSPPRRGGLRGRGAGIVSALTFSGDNVVELPAMSSSSTASAVTVPRVLFGADSNPDSGDRSNGEPDNAGGNEASPPASVTGQNAGGAGGVTAQQQHQQHQQQQAQAAQAAQFAAHHHQQHQQHQQQQHQQQQQAHWQQQQVIAMVTNMQQELQARQNMMQQQAAQAYEARRQEMVAQAPNGALTQEQEIELQAMYSQQQNQIYTWWQGEAFRIQQVQQSLFGQGANVGRANGFVPAAAGGGAQVANGNNANGGGQAPTQAPINHQTGAGSSEEAESGSQADQEGATQESAAVPEATPEDAAVAAPSSQTPQQQLQQQQQQAQAAQAAQAAHAQQMQAMHQQQLQHQQHHQQQQQQQQQYYMYAGAQGGQGGYNPAAGAFPANGHDAKLAGASPAPPQAFYPAGQAQYYGAQQHPQHGQVAYAAPNGVPAVNGGVPTGTVSGGGGMGGATATPFVPAGGPVTTDSGYTVYNGPVYAYNYGYPAGAAGYGGQQVHPQQMHQAQYHHQQQQQQHHQQQAMMYAANGTYVPGGPVAANGGAMVDDPNMGRGRGRRGRGRGRRGRGRGRGGRGRGAGRGGDGGEGSGLPRPSGICHNFYNFNFCNYNACHFPHVPKADYDTWIAEHPNEAFPTDASHFSHDLTAGAEGGKGGGRNGSRGRNGRGGRGGRGAGGRGSSKGRRNRNNRNGNTDHNAGGHGSNHTNNQIGSGHQNGQAEADGGDAGGDAGGDVAPAMEPPAASTPVVATGEATRADGGV